MTLLLGKLQIETTSGGIVSQRKLYLQQKREIKEDNSESWDSPSRGEWVPLFWGRVNIKKGVLSSPGEVGIRSHVRTSEIFLYMHHTLC